MARIFGIEIPNEKRIEASLPYIYGVGPSTAKRILEQAGVDPNIRTGQLLKSNSLRLLKSSLLKLSLLRVTFAVKSRLL